MLSASPFSYCGMYDKHTCSKLDMHASSVVHHQDESQHTSCHCHRYRQRRNATVWSRLQRADKFIIVLNQENPIMKHVTREQRPSDASPLPSDDQRDRFVHDLERMGKYRMYVGTSSKFTTTMSQSQENIARLFKLFDEQFCPQQRPHADSCFFHQNAVYYTDSRTE